MKIVLYNDNIAECFFEDTKLLGIMAPINNYQFCWFINNLLGMDFRVNNEIEIQLTKRNRNYFFAVYEFNEPTNSLSHYVYNNQFDGEYLLHEFKHLDFLWLMKGGAVDDFTINQKMDSLRSINNVQLVVELTHENIKSKDHLVF